MHRALDRRDLIRTFGLGAVLVTAGRLPASPLGARGFTHNVASGEPGPQSMLLWTRFVPADGGADVRLTAEIATDANFAHVVAGGQVRTGAHRDWTAKITLDGLVPGTDYYYRFVAPDGRFSATGRTRTLPVGNVDRFGLALFSCSHLSFGWFNAYRHAAVRDDLDLWLHVGDYIYEDGDFPLVPGRAVEPVHEAVALADYRLRFACYRSDPDLQALHQRAPMVALWDDHETADDSWEGGARNHQPASEGAWDVRKAAAIQAYREWMPVSDEPWKAYRLGALATLYRTESRLLARTRQRASSAMDGPNARSRAVVSESLWGASARSQRHHTYSMRTRLRPRGHRDGRRGEAAAACARALFSGHVSGAARVAWGRSRCSWHRCMAPDKPPPDTGSSSPSRRSCDLYAYGRLVFVHGRRLLVRLLVRLLMRLRFGARLGSALALGGPEAVKVRREGVVFEDRQLLAVTQGG